MFRAKMFAVKTKMHIRNAWHMLMMFIYSKISEEDGNPGRANGIP